MGKPPPLLDPLPKARMLLMPLSRLSEPFTFLSTMLVFCVSINRPPPPFPSHRIPSERPISKPMSIHYYHFARGLFRLLSSSLTDVFNRFSRTLLGDKSFKKMSDQEWDIITAIHLKGAFECSKAVWPIFRKQKVRRTSFDLVALCGKYGHRRAKTGHSL